MYVLYLSNTVTATYNVSFAENIPRADRLQALINHVAIIQTDVAREKKRMDELDKHSREVLNTLLERGEIKTLEELNKEAMERLTPEQRKEYQALIEVTKQVGQITNTVLWAGLVLGGEKIITVGAPFLLSLARGLAAMQGVQGILGAIVGVSEGIAAGATAAGEGLAQAAQRATQTVTESGAAGAAAVGKTGAAAGAATETAVAETKKVTSSLTFMSKYGKWLSRLGVVLLAVVPLVELVYGKAQRDKLVEGIHDTQVARLVIAALRQEARQVTENMNSIKSYLEFLKGNKTTSAQEFGEELIRTIRSQHAQIDLTRIEKELRGDIDKDDSYKKDDLEIADVVLLALKEQTDSEEKRALEVKEGKPVV
ncbi:hypothetical protein H0H87_010945 [Tephrocybe sp. NHM501043]|nr:hypothetical protein H0H87_010945 [Tephrocybe sp. NHM501043]